MSWKGIDPSHMDLQHLANDHYTTSPTGESSYLCMVANPFQIAYNKFLTLTKLTWCTRWCTWQQVMHQVMSHAPGDEPGNAPCTRWCTMCQLMHQVIRHVKDNCTMHVVLNLVPHLKHHLVHHHGHGASPWAWCITMGMVHHLVHGAITNIRFLWGFFHFSLSFFFFLCVFPLFWFFPFFFCFFPLLVFRFSRFFSPTSPHPPLPHPPSPSVFGKSEHPKIKKKTNASISKSTRWKYKGKVKVLLV